MNLSDKNSVLYLYFYLKQIGIKNIVICPGSRNLAIINSFSNSPDFQLHTVIDERAAGFIALGIAKSTALPVVVITTSGSAALNLAPALLEAFYNRIPLMAITADRPTASVDKGENQTFHQTGIFKNYIVKELELDERIEFSLAEKKFNELHPFLFLPSLRGPIHINMPLSEPLLTRKTVLGEFKFDLHNISENRTGNYEKLLSVQDKKILIYNTLAACSTDIQEKLAYGIQFLNWTVVNELQTNAHINGSIEYFDRMIANHPSLSFEVLITIGDQMISKTAREYFKSQKKLTHIDVAPYARKWDNLASKNSSIRSNEIDFLNRMLELKISSNKGFHDEWSALDAKEKSNYHDFIRNAQWKEFSLVDHIVQSFKKSTYVFWGNSSLIRYAHWAAKNSNIHNLVNRGISGIDGVLSTAIGYQAIIQAAEFYCILGDVSMLYESNALQSIHLVDNFKIIVFNNFGGKIFQNIHQPEDAKIVVTEHDYHFFHLAKMYDIEYYVCDNLQDFQKTFLEFQALRNTRAILELVLPEDSNSQWNTHLKHRASIDPF